METATQAKPTSAVDPALLQHSVLEPELIINPWKYYSTLRHGDPVHYDESIGMYLVSRYEDLQTVVKDPFTFSVGHAWMRTFAPDHFEEFKKILIRDGGGYFPDAIMTDPPQHTRVRRLMQAAFTPRRIKQLEPVIRRIAADLIDKLAVRGEGDGVKDFAMPMTMGIMCEQLGLGSVDHAKISQWARSFSNVRTNLTREQLAVEAGHFCDLQNYIIERVRERQKERREDMISDLIYAREEGDGNPTLNFEEIVSLTRALVIGGLDSIGTALSNMLFQVATSPAVAAKFEEAVADDTKLSRFIEESLRFEPPARGLFRATTKEVELGGTRLPKDAMLCLLFASANEDETMFDHTREFDMDRKNLNRNMTFGMGIHMCVGMHLARMEVKVAAQEVGRRLTNIKLAVPRGDLKYHSSLAMLSLANLPLTFARRQ